MVWLRVLDVPSRALLPPHVLGVLVGRDGADRLLHHRIWPARRLRLFPHHLKRSDVSGLHGEAILVKAEKALCGAEV